MSETSHELPTTTTARLALRLMQWLVLSVVVVTALTLFSVHVSNRIKLLGLFPIAFGLVSGWCLGRLARLARIHYPALALLAAFAVITLGQVGLRVESHRRYAALLRDQFRADPNTLVAMHTFHAAAIPDDPAARGSYDQMRQTMEGLEREHEQELADRSSFGAFLEHRVANLGLTRRWAAVFWVAELLAGSLLGAWLVCRSAGVRYCTRCESWHERQRSLLLDAESGRHVLDLLQIDPQRTMGENSRVGVSFVSCRCANAASELHCLLEEPNGRVHSLGAATAEPDILRRLSDLLDGGSTFR